MDSLHNLNESIVNLGDTLKRAGAGEDKGEDSQKEARDQVGQVGLQVQEDSQIKQKKGEDTLKDNEATETLQDLDKEKH